MIYCLLNHIIFLSSNYQYSCLNHFIKFLFNLISTIAILTVISYFIMNLELLFFPKDFLTIFVLFYDFQRNLERTVVHGTFNLLKDHYFIILFSSIVEVTMVFILIIEKAFYELEPSVKIL